MAKLIFQSLCSLDGYVNDEHGEFGFAAPDAEVHGFVNELERSVGTYLFGRRLYETMVAWETLDLTDEPQVMRDYAEIWRAADKVVFSTSLAGVSSARTRLERRFDDDAVAALKKSATRDIAVGGPTLAALALEAGLVDEVRLFLSPAVIGGGTNVFPEGFKIDLELMEQRRFGNGTVYLRYWVKG